ncbi:hypothetical protein [Anaerocellum danielii]|uniref:Uncharacterized protein n=1 Tax=Anaerocellum danielii TaxID=1387557 RepID=A0ABZ0U0G5_9FIRM|nr:hypothetical protein [Caldicellulosiruptor danielii]WPX08193.1 hypothetical protein SOJ16_002059 [Caldicellulosiruptor danielii]
MYVYEQEVEKAFLESLEELFNTKYPVQKLSWATLWRRVNSKLSSTNPYKNGYGKGKPYPAKNIIEKVEQNYWGKTLDLKNCKVLFSIVKTADGYTDCYTLSQQFERTPNKEAIQLLERALSQPDWDFSEMFAEYSY